MRKNIVAKRAKHFLLRLVARETILNVKNRLQKRKAMMAKEI